MWHQLEVPLAIIAGIVGVVIWLVISIRDFGQAMDLLDVDYDAEDDLDRLL